MFIWKMVYNLPGIYNYATKIGQICLQVIPGHVSCNFVRLRLTGLYKRFAYPIPTPRTLTIISCYILTRELREVSNCRI